MLRTILDNISRNSDDIINGCLDINKTKKLLIDYLNHSSGVLLNLEDIIHASEVLRRHIESFAIATTDVDFVLYVTKQDLLNKDIWYNKLDIPYFDNSTSGSTGEPFKYRIWSQAYKVIESAKHYDAVLKEFGVSSSGIRILHVQQGSLGSDYKQVGDLKISETGDGILWNHGYTKPSLVTHVMFPGTFYQDWDKYIEQVVDLMVENNYDVLCSNGSFTGALAAYFSQVHPMRLCNLISNTCDKVDSKDLNQLLDQGITGSICDHMRCWDGGATFMTCRFGNKHLFDDISWCYSLDGKLISTDYFNLSSPFVNYWNGDSAFVTNTYDKCACGRWYRHFNFDDPREFVLKGGLSINKLQSNLRSDIDDVRIVHDGDEITVISKHNIPDEFKQSLKQKLNDYNVSFNQALSDIIPFAGGTSTSKPVSSSTI